MCGIAGFLDHSQNSLRYDFKGVATSMAETMLTRGPNDGGVWIDQANKIGLAHRRLAVIDLTSARQQPFGIAQPLQALPQGHGALLYR